MMKQVILIRKDLKMRRGKEIAQGAHASMAFLLANRGNGYVSSQVNEWLKGGQTKVCLQVHSEEELVELYNKAIENHLGTYTHMITDAGRTEFDGVPTKTCVAIGPAPSKLIDEITGHLKLY